MSISYNNGLSLDYLSSLVKNSKILESDAAGWLFRITFLAMCFSSVIHQYYYGFFEIIVLFFFFSPLIVVFLISLMETLRYVRAFSLASSFLILSLSWIFFNHFTCLYLFDSFGSSLSIFKIFGYDFSIGFDGLSFIFILLTCFLIMLCVIVSWESIIFRQKEYYMLLFLLEFFLFGVFLTNNLILFYIFFEGVLLPMFLIIGVWGSRARRVFASYQFFLYTFFGSIFMLLGILFIYFLHGVLDFEFLYEWTWGSIISNQGWLWLSFFLGLAIKVPIMPFHIWLPEAHVEAPTAGSVLLAGILLKLGGYGLLRFVVGFFSVTNYFFKPFVFVLCVFSIIYTSCVTLCQIDLKKIIAYSSVAHMNFVVLGLFTNSIISVSGSILLMLSHAVISGALFICVGALYDRYKTRSVFYYGGFVQLMPLFAVFFFILIFANVGFPTTANFVGELTILAGLFEVTSFVTVCALVGTILGGVYSVWLLNRVIFGGLSNFIECYSDVNVRETWILVSLCYLNFVMGVYPSFFFDVFRGTVGLALGFSDVSWGMLTFWI